MPGVPEDRSVTNTQHHSKDPRTKNPGVFVYSNESMTETDSKKQREADFIRQHTLTDEDLRKMILEKLERARIYSQAVRKREIAQG